MTNRPGDDMSTDEETLSGLPYRAQDDDLGDDLDDEPELTDLDSLSQHLRAETRTALVPATAAAIGGGVDLAMHNTLTYALQSHLISHGLLDLGIAAGSNLVLTVAAALVLANRDAIDGLPGHRPLKRRLRENETPPVPTMKPLLLGASGTGAALTVFGATRFGLAAYVGGFLAATAAWHVKRLKERRAIRREIRETLALTAGPDLLQLTAGHGTDPLDLPTLDDDDLPSVRGDLVTIMEQWALGVASRYATGTRLIRPVDHGDGRMEFVVDAGDTGVQLATLNAARASIHAALHLELPDAHGQGGQSVEFDQPGGGILDHSGQVRMQILDKASATSVAARVGWDFKTRPGNPYSPEIGVYVDDGSPMFWDLADHHGAWSGVVIASSGFGKSALIAQLILRAMQLAFETVFIDPQGGASSPVAAANVTWPVLGKPSMHAGYELMEALAENREDWLAMHPGISEITPGMQAPCAPNGSAPDPDCPCGGITPPPVLCAVMECHLVFGASVIGGGVTKMGKLWGDLATRIRKLCMEIVAETQYGDQPAFGGSEPLRTSLAKRNYLAGHIPSTSADMIPGLPYPPVRIPDIVGRALFAGNGSRKMEGTLHWLPNRSHAHLVPDGAGPFAEDLFAMLPKRASYWLDEEAARRILVQLDPAQAYREGARNRFRAKAAALTGGHPATPPATPPAAAALEPTPTVTAASLAPTIEGDWPQGVLPSAGPPSAALRAAMAAVAAETTSTPADVDAQDARTVLWNLMMIDHNNGVISTKASLMERSRYSETTVRNVLNGWLNASPPRVRRDEHGQWTPNLPVEAAR